MSDEGTATVEPSLRLGNGFCQDERGPIVEGWATASGVEIFLVWFKLFVLAGLAAYGLNRWNPELVGRGVPDVGPAQTPESMGGRIVTWQLGDSDG